MSEPVIRFMRLKDVDQVAEIEQATFARPWSRESFRQEVTRNAVASNLGASYATLEVRVSNLRAQNLYKSLGFVSVGKRKRYYEDNNEDAFLMVCEHMPEVDPDYTEEPWIEKEDEQ